MTNDKPVSGSLVSLPDAPSADAVGIAEVPSEGVIRERVTSTSNASGGVRHETTGSEYRSAIPRTAGVAVAAAERTSAFRIICNRLVSASKELTPHLDGDEVAESGLSIILNVEELLDELYAADTSRTEFGKRAAIALQVQLLNVNWRSAHVRFLKEAASFLAGRAQLDDFALAQLIQITKECGLDPFRGTVSEPSTRVRYQIVACDESSA